MRNLFLGFILGMILTLAVMAVYLCKVTFQYNSANYSDLQGQVNKIIERMDNVCNE